MISLQSESFSTKKVPKKFPTKKELAVLGSFVSKYLVHHKAALQGFCMCMNQITMKTSICMFYQYIKYIFSQKPIHIYQLISYFSSFLCFFLKKFQYFIYLLTMLTIIVLHVVLMKQIFNTSVNFSVSSDSHAAGEGEYLSRLQRLASSFLSTMLLPLRHGIKGIYLLFPTLLYQICSEFRAGNKTP